MPYYYDISMFRWFTGRSKRRKRTEDSPPPNLITHPDHHARPRTSFRLDSLMNLDRSHIHDITLRNAPWYQAGLAREIALDILQQEEVGAFIVRDSSTHPGCFALSVRVPKFENSSGISHYLILRTHRGVKLKGLDKEWSTLHALVTHHTVMREMLPCTLRLPKTATAPLMPADESRSSGDGMERGDNYTDMSTTHAGGGGHPPLLKVVSGVKNF